MRRVRRVALFDSTPSFLYSVSRKREAKMAAMHPAVVWLIVAAVVGITLLIATFFANRNRNKKKKSKFSVMFSEVLSLNSEN